MRGQARRTAATIGVGLIALAAAGCGSSSHKSSSQSSSSGGSKTTAAAASPKVVSSGPGFNQPTAPQGARIKGGTVTFQEAPSTPPSYIFPMTSAQVCGVQNTSQFSEELYRPLYWFGNNYSPTVDYSYSVGNKPTFSDGDKTVTVTMKDWKWSDGESVTSRDVELWINMYKANPDNYCGAVPGYMPTIIKSMSLPNAHTFTLHLKTAVNPEWFQYNELSQITPVPLAWDRTSLSQKAPTSASGKLPDETKAGAQAVYNFLNKQSNALTTWASSPIWSVVDGPFKLQSFTTNGQATMVPNPTYSGSPKPSIAKFIELPYTSDTAAFNEIRSGGPNAITVGSIPPQDVPQVPALKRAGFVYSTAGSYSFNYFPLNLHNPNMGPVFSQLYFRQAFQHLIDQPGWIKAFLGSVASPTYTPIPSNPASPLASVNASANPFPYSPTAAATLLKDNGWKVVPGGSTSCIKPGTAAGDCGAGIAKGKTISFNVDYASGLQSLTSEMSDLQANAKKVGITLDLTNHPFKDVIGKATICSPKQPTCGWTAENWGAGWVYSPDYLPTGETLYATGSVANYSNYSNPQADKLIAATVKGGSAATEKTSLTNFANYIAKQVPVVYGPTSIGSYQSGGGTVISPKLGGYTANVFDQFTPENWYLTK